MLIMLTRRFHRLFKVSERVTLFRLYFPGNNVHSNLQALNNVPRSLHCFCTRRSLVPIFKRNEGFLAIDEQAGIIARSNHTEIDDNLEEKRYDSENAYARNLLLNSSRDFKSFAHPLKPIENINDEDAERILSKNWRVSNIDEILEAFVSLSSHAKLNSQCLQQEKHRGILMAITEKLSQISDGKLRRIFQCLLAWDNITKTKCPTYINLWHELDRECMKRIMKWNAEECLLMWDHWYCLNLAKKAKYPSNMLKKLGKNPRKLNAKDFLHFIFIINVSRKPPFNMYEVEYAFENLLDEYTPDELAVVSMGFFKSQSPFRNEDLVSRINRKLINDLDNTGDISISAIMKITRYSTGLKDLKIFTEILHRLAKRVPDLSIPCMTNILHAAAYVQWHDNDLMKLAIEKYEREIDNARIKDLERLTWVLGIFDYDNSIPLYAKIVDSFHDPRRKTELEHFPRIIPTTLCHLSQLRIFPTDLIKQHFEPDFFKRVFGHNAYKIGRDFFSLETNLRIEMPEYDGPFLQPGIRDFLAKKFLWSRFQTNDKVRPSDKFLMEVVHTCKLAVGSETSIYIDQILPHYVKPDIMICLDEITNSPIDPEPILSNIPTGTIKFAPTEPKNAKWIAIVLATQNQLIRGTDRYVGPLKCKLRQLEIIGYSPLVISYTEWRELTSLDAKEDFLRKQLRLTTNRNASIAAL